MAPGRMRVPMTATHIDPRTTCSAGLSNLTSHPRIDTLARLPQMAMVRRDPHNFQRSNRYEECFGYRWRLRGRRGRASAHADGRVGGNPRRTGALSRRRQPDALSRRAPPYLRTATLSDALPEDL